MAALPTRLIDCAGPNLIPVRTERVGYPSHREGGSDAWRPDRSGRAAVELAAVGGDDYQGCLSPT